MALAKSTGSKAKQTVALDKSYETGVTYKVGITNPQYAGIGNLDPAKVRAINIKKANSVLQEEWANEWLTAVKQIESSRAAIEKMRADIEKIHFKTEAEIDEYILGALLAKTEYEAHYREWMARKASSTAYINGGADEEIKAVSAEFADRIRLRKTKTDARIAASREKTDAEISQVGQAKDRTQAIEQAQAKQRLKAFMRGDDMAVVESIGASGTNALSGNNSGILGAITSGSLFSFK